MSLLLRVKEASASPGQPIQMFVPNTTSEPELNAFGRNFARGGIEPDDEYITV